MAYVILASIVIMPPMLVVWTAHSSGEPARITDSFDDPSKDVP